MARPATTLVLKEKEMKAIKDFASSTKSKREYKRAQVILYKARGMPVHQIADLLDLHWRTVQRILSRYRRDGVASFKDKPRPGGKPKLTNEAREKLLSVALKNPRLFGFLKTNWSLGCSDSTSKRKRGST